MDTIQIDKGIPIPQCINIQTKPELVTMEVGDSCVLTEKQRNAFQQHCYRFQKKIASRKLPGTKDKEPTYRVWRIK